VVFTDPLDNLPKMWVIGGTDASGVVLHDVYKSTDGASWYPATTSAPFGELGTESAVVFDAGQGAGPEIWVVGNSDGTAYNQLYHSKNGVTWSSSTSNFMLGPGHTVVTFPDVNDGNKMKIWVIGGHAGWTPAQIILPTSASEVWNSSDGVNFAQVVGTTTTVANITSGVATPGLLLYNNFHTCVVFTDPADGISKLWVIGGGGNGFAGCSTACPTVFCSVDGKTWEPKTNTAGFGQRDYHQSFVYCGRMWLIGGYQGGCCGFDNDVWNSTDGITWYQETAAATTAITPPLVPTGLSETVDGGRARFGAIPYNGALWIFGGTKTISGVGSWDLNDVWKTP
jgi:hypothetical protein